MSSPIKENPILWSVRAYLDIHKQPFSEYELLQELSRSAVFDKLDFLQDIDSNLGLFYRHFLIMNALYTLQDKLWESKKSILRVSPLKIEQFDSPAGLSNEKENLLSIDIQYVDNLDLKKYYLDLNNLFAQSSESIEDLLVGFWQEFSKHSSDSHTYRVDTASNFRVSARYIESCDILGVDANDELVSIRNAYRKKVISNHPDRGGRAEDFIAVREAYEYLKAFYT